MIDNNRIDEILNGIDKDCTTDDEGWFETSFGASFGAKKLEELKTYIDKEKNDTGLKDINDKPIYADSSIVELKVIINGYRKQSYTRTLKGSFEFNEEDLRYEINIYGESDYVCIWYDPVNMSNLKIIDTIQENKLGLVK